MEKLKDIFISYKNDGEGNHFAARLCEDLKHEGYSVYFNPDEGKTGNFPERLRKAIYACKDFVCIVTRGYMDDLKENTDDVCWIRDELLCTKKYARHIVPILVIRKHSRIVTSQRNTAVVWHVFILEICICLDAAVNLMKIKLFSIIVGQRKWEYMKRRL